MSEPTTQAQPNQPTPSIPISGTPPTRLRLWPGVVLVALLWAARAWTSIGEFAMYKFFIGMFITPLVVLVGLVLWWLFASRLRWSDRFLIVGTFVAVTAVTMFVAHESFRGMALMMYGLPAVATGSVAWLAVSFALPWSVRRAGVLAIYLATGVFCCLLRIDGMDGAFNPKFSWRSQPTAEQKFLATMKAKPESRPAWIRPPLSVSSRETGPVSAARTATAVCRACGSRPIGGNRRRGNYGTTLSVPAGRRSP